MATRFYIHPFNEPTETFDPDAAWDFTGVASSLRMFPYRSGFEIINRAATETSATANLDTLIAQFVSPPLTTQTITGTFHGAMMARESASGADIRSQCVVRVVAEDGTVRGTLISASTASLANEWTASTTAWRNARFPMGSSGASVTSVNAVAGDRIVVEVGYRAHNSSSTSFSGTLRVGNGATNADLPSNDTQTTATTDNPWFEFSQTLNFDVTEYDIYDDIADAVDALPDPLTERLYRADLSAFTLEPDDPAQLQGDYSATVVSGWVRMDAPADGPAVLSLLTPMGGHESWPYLWAFDEVPDSASSTGFLFPYDNENPAQLVIPAGEFRYLALGTDPTWAGTVSDVFLIARRVDSGTPTGDIKDDIADAVDVFPASTGTETVSETTNLTWFTTETDDPTEVAAFTGNTTAYTGWLKLIVPSAASVTISIADTTDAQDLMFFLYDEVPTASSVAIFMSDEDSPVPSFSWPYLPEIALAAGTYYLLIAPFEGTNWSTYEGGYLAVRVRWEAEPTVEDFSVDAIVLQTFLPPMWTSVQPTLVDSVSGAVDDAISLSLTIPVTAQANDILLLNATVDQESSAFSTIFNSVLTAPSSGTGNLFTTLATTRPLTSNHMLRSAYVRWNGVGDTVSVSTSSISPAGAKAAVLTVWRNAGIPVFHTASSSVTTSASLHQTPAYSVPSSNANYGQEVTLVAAFAGAAASVITWTPFGSLTEIEDVSATSLANIMVGTLVTTYDDFVENMAATPSAAEFFLAHSLHVPPNPVSFDIAALIQPGGVIPFNAVIAGPISTKHDRTRYHYGVTPAENIISSRTYGAFPPGTTLQEVLEGLDTLITDLENQS